MERNKSDRIFFMLFKKCTIHLDLKIMKRRLFKMAWMTIFVDVAQGLLIHCTKCLLFDNWRQAYISYLTWFSIYF